MYFLKLEHLARISLLIFLGIIIIYTIFPIYWLFATSLKFEIDQFANPPLWIDFDPTLEHYSKVLSRDFFGTYFLNSLINATVSALISLTLGILAGYSLARFKFPKNLNNHLSFGFLSVRMFPPIVSIIPFISLYKTLYLLNTRWALIISYSLFNLPFVVWMMKGFIQEIPTELEELGLIDGISRIEAFLKITLPLSIPGIFVTAVFCFIIAWNELLYAIILAQTNSAFTLPVAIAENITQYSINWGELGASGIIATIPVIALAFMVQKLVVRGFTLGAVRD